MFSKPPLRIFSLVHQALEVHKVNHLVDLINTANTGTGCKISRSLVRNIRDNPEAVGLTWSHMVAFHTYFQPLGYSLQHLSALETRGIFEALGEQQELLFMYGARTRPEEQRTDNSHWDTKAQVELVRHASQVERAPTIDACEVLWRSPVDPATIGTEPWYHILEEDQASVMSIGSPLASLSSEIMLSRMFGVKAFEPRRVPQRALPFYFVWLHKVAAQFRSAFGLTWEDLRAEHPDLARRVQRNATTAMVLEGAIRESPIKSHEWTMYGIIAAQRRSAGNIWVVIAGLHGPATLGAATKVCEITDELPWSSKGPSKVLWVPVKVQVRAPKAKPSDGDIRQVVGADFDGKPRVWPEDK